MSTPPALPRRALLVTGAVLLVALVAAGVTALRDHLAVAASRMDQGEPALLAIASLLFAAGMVLHGHSWRAGLRAGGDHLGRTDAASRYAIGSLANSLLPFHAGSVVRVTLFAAAARDVRAATGVAAAHGGVGGLAVALLVAVAATLEPMPAWPAGLLAAGAIGAALVSRLVARAPLRCAGLALFAVGGLAARIGAASFVCLAYGIPRPALAGMTVIAALEIAGMLPLTPGNLGLSTAAASFALAAHGAPNSLALTIGIALPAIETSTSIAMGLAGVAILARRVPTCRAGRAAPPAPAPLPVPGG